MYTINPALRYILEPLLTKHEAKRRFPYDDSTGQPPKLPGNLTIGIGRNLSAKGLSEAEIQYLLNNDIREAEEDAIYLLGEKVYRQLSLNRQAVVISMAFNLGRLRFAGFRNTLQAIKDGRYNDAAAGMRGSLWADQVGNRAEELSEMMKHG